MWKRRECDKRYCSASKRTSWTISYTASTPILFRSRTRALKGCQSLSYPTGSGEMTRIGLSKPGTPAPVKKVQIVINIADDCDIMGLGLREKGYFISWSVVAEAEVPRWQGVHLVLVWSESSWALVHASKMAEGILPSAMATGVMAGLSERDTLRADRRISVRMP